MSDRMFKLTMAVLIAVLAIMTAFGITMRPAHAETQPDEVSIDHHCEAAGDVMDTGSIIVYCKQSAENHAIDAQDEYGEVKAGDLCVEAAALVMVGLAVSQTGTDDPQAYYSQARSTYLAARRITHKSRTIAQIDHNLNDIP